MGNTYNFYGDVEDIFQIWEFLASLPGMRFVETHSKPNSENRYFDEIPNRAFMNDENFAVAAWPTIVGGVPRKKILRLSSESAARLRESGRSVLESPAFIKMTEAPVPNEKYIGPTEMRYWTEKSAQKYGTLDFDEAQIADVDWPKLKSVTDQIISHIKRASHARWNSMPVLPGCAERLRAESKKLWFWGREGTV